MGLFRRPRTFEPARLDDDGRTVFRVNLDQEVRSWLVGLADQLDELLAHDVDETRRLFPTAYPDDPELDAGYQILSRQQLIDRKRAAVASMHRTVTVDEMTEDDLGQWMGILNDLRLVLGTRLDVDENDHDLHKEAPDFEVKMLYHQLGALVHELVEALTGTLPDEPTDNE